MHSKQSDILMRVVEMVNSSDISSIKFVVSEILRIIRDETTGAKDLKEVIEKDPPLCGKVLKLANSAQYGYPRTINSIQDAIVCIGFEAVKGIALNQKVCELFMNDYVQHGYSRWSLWQHSLGVAICAKIIFQKHFGEKGDDIYAAGLLHDIGIIVEDQFFTETFFDALTTAMYEIRNLDEVEREIMSVNHADIGKAVAVSWDFPEELIQAIGCHHEPENAAKGTEKYVQTTFMANYICYREKIGFVGVLKRDINQFQSCLKGLKMSVKTLDKITEDLKEELKKQESISKLSV